jgi:Protein of unknown function (DUF1186)/SEC-C motif
MEPAAILEKLMHFDDLPREAIRAAGERRAEMVPLLIGEIERFLAGSAAEPEEGAWLLLPFHVLGEWREAGAYPVLARLLASDTEKVECAIGDALTETAPRVMAAVFDGDPQPLYNIILNENADEFVRSGMCETLAMLVVQGRLDRAEVAAFLRDCWIGLRPREDCFVWHGWQQAIAALGLVELEGLVKEAFDRGIASSRWLRYSDFESNLEHAVRQPTQPWEERAAREFDPFVDTIEELSGWYCFSEQYKLDRERARNAPPLPLFPPPEPTINPLRGVGRNDPCPCGSGKKYKKCCLQ